MSLKTTTKNIIYRYDHVWAMKQLVDENKNRKLLFCFEKKLYTILTRVYHNQNQTQIFCEIESDLICISLHRNTCAENCFHFSFLRTASTS